MKTIFIYVQHLLGTGHLHRVALITAALAKNNFKIFLVSGGIETKNIYFGDVVFHQLPAIKSDAEFSNLYDENNQCIDDAFKQDRKSKLLSFYKQVKPDFVMIETYPFGRRQMRFELLPLLDEIQAQGDSRPLVSCSIRDVIQPKENPKRITEVIKLVETYFDYIFVHGDKKFITFEYSFPQATAFSHKLLYTGYIHKPQRSSNETGRNKNQILVSAGGGAVGQTLYQIAIDAANKKSGKRYQWHILVGDNISPALFEELSQKRSQNITIERNRPDFVDLLMRCSISLSQAGYNTIMDIISTETSSLVVPFEGESEKEQLIRALALEEKGLLSILREKELSVSSLLCAISRIGNNKQRCPITIDLNGAETIVDLINQEISSKTKK